MACTWERHVGRAPVSAHGPLSPLIPKGRGAPPAAKAVHSAACGRASTSVLGLMLISCLILVPHLQATDLV